MDPKKVLEESYGLVQEVVSSIWMSKGGPRAELDEFASYVHLKLIEDDYRRIRLFNGESSLKTYLYAVILRLRLDLLSQNHGRWRSSGKAKKLGLLAMELEELIGRDGLSLEQAESVLKSRGRSFAAGELERLATDLPDRQRPQTVALEDSETKPSNERSDASWQARADRERKDDLHRALRKAISELDAEDQMILRLRFESEISANLVGQQLGLAQRQVYSRVERCKRQIKRQLTAEGFEPWEVLGLLGLDEDEPGESDE